MSELILDGHKLAWHRDRVEAWLRGERIAPITIDCALTRRCTYRCVYCYGQFQANDEKRMTRDVIFRFLDDVQSQDRCNACDARENCPLHGRCAFMPMWDRVQNAIYNVYDHTTIQDLLENESGLQMIADTMPGKQRHALS